MKTFSHKQELEIMEEGKRNNNILSRLPKWIKNPFVLTGLTIVVVVITYFLLPFLKTIESPFTQYKPLPIDSTYIKLETSATIKTVDSIKIIPDSIDIDKIEEEEPASDSSSIADLFKLNTDYQELDPNEQLNRSKEEPDDLFTQLILADLEPSEIQKLEDIKVSLGISPILQLLSATAVEMLSGVQTKYQLNIIEAMELAPTVQGILITDRTDKVIYATNKKFNNQYLFEVFPRSTLTAEKLIIQEVANLQLISMPVYHQYGKIGTTILIIED